MNRHGISRTGWALIHLDVEDVGKMSVSGYSDQRFKPLVHKYAMSLSETLASVDSAVK